MKISLKVKPRYMTKLGGWPAWTLLAIFLGITVVDLIGKEWGWVAVNFAILAFWIAADTLLDLRKERKKATPPPTATLDGGTDG